MSEATIADFVARFLPDDRMGPEPETGRVVLSQKRLVLASGGGRTTIPLADVFDVVVGHVPRDLSDYFDDTVAVAYTVLGERRTAVVEADAETIARFRTVLFKALLGGATVRIKHPAKVGGRYTDAEARKASLRLEERAVTFRGLETPLRIDLSAVTYMEKTDLTINGRTRPALNVQFTEGGQAMTSEIVMSTSRRMNLLGRYLRLEYSDLLGEINDIDISDVETELLVALYSGAAESDAANVLGRDPSTVTMLLNGLEEKELVASTEEGTKLTSLGRLAVSDRVETVNA